MRATTRLPGRDDGAAGLLALADQLGDETVFNLIRRCRTAQGKQVGGDPAGETLTVLAHSMVKAEKDRTGSHVDTARLTVARQLGYTGTSTSNFNRIMDGEGGPGDDELLELAARHGAAAVFNLIRLCRNSHRQAEDAGREALTILANRMVDREMDRTNTDRSVARQVVADRLGYTRKADGHGRSNFWKILKGGRPPETRPNSSKR
jgi:hypothetical protein